MYMSTPADPVRTSSGSNRTLMHDPTECPPKLHFCLRVGGTPRPPFPPDPLDSNKVQQGGRLTGFWACQLQTRVTRAQMESCTDLSYILFELLSIIQPTCPTCGAFAKC